MRIRFLAAGAYGELCRVADGARITARARRLGIRYASAAMLRLRVQAAACMGICRLILHLDPRGEDSLDKGVVRSRQDGGGRYALGVASGVLAVRLGVGRACTSSV